MQVSIRETISALKTWPEAKHWQSAVTVAIPAMVVIVGLGFLGGWLSWNPTTDWQTASLTAIILFFVPAFFEELFFRGVLLSWLAARWTRWSAWISTLLFVLWHPLQAFTTGPPWADVFLESSFLFSTLILGIILAHVRIVTRSLWPAILIHWFAVLVWKLLLGGPY